MKKVKVIVIASSTKEEKSMGWARILPLSNRNNWQEVGGAHFDKSLSPVFASGSGIYDLEIENQAEMFSERPKYLIKSADFISALEDLG